MRAFAFAMHLFLIAAGGCTEASDHSGPGDRRAGDGAAIVAPRRIVSLNPCLDAILIEVARPSQVAGLSHLSSDPDASLIVEQARRFPVAGASAESVLAMHPDLVLASSHTLLATRNALVRARVPLSLFEVPSSVEESRVQIRRVASLVGNARGGERLIARIGQALASARHGGPDVTALIYHPNGLSPGAETLPNDLLRLTGFRNMAVAYGLTGWRQPGLELLVSRPPSLLMIAEQGNSKEPRTLGNRTLRTLRDRVRQESIPAKLLYCGGPTIIAASASLAVLRRGQER
jgi:iron complex transport system substrate-binding protein